MRHKFESNIQTQLELSKISNSTITQRSSAHDPLGMFLADKGSWGHVFDPAAPELVKELCSDESWERAKNLVNTIKRRSTWLSIINTVPRAQGSWFVLVIYLDQ